MFCADYVASLIAHAAVTVGAAWLGQPWLAALAVNRTDGERSLVLPFVAGGLAGLGGAVAVFPFDFVRAAVAPPNTSQLRLLAGSLSTVPYAACWFGVYYTFRDKDRLGSQCGWALLASSAAVAAEAPFDGAKRALFGGCRRTHLGVNLLFVPFAAMMLLMHDRSMDSVLACMSIERCQRESSG